MGNTYLPALQALYDWFERQKRVLPWRENPSVYRVWISEIMLQQTQVATVVPYFERFIARFPTVEALAEALEQDVLTHWAGLGYYSRARNLQKAARQIAAAGEFPRDRAGWLAVPGVGPYTAGAVLSIALDQPEAILDGNVERVVARVRAVGKRAPGWPAFAREALKRRYWRLSRIWIRDAHRRLALRPSQFNQALMELGATICTPRNPKCLACPLSVICRAFQRGEPMAYPLKGKAKEWIHLDERVLAVLNERGEIRLEQQAAGKWRAGLWDLPVIQAPSPSAAPKQARSKTRARVGRLEVRYVVTRHKVSRAVEISVAPAPTHASGAVWSASEPNGDDPSERKVRWVSLNEAERIVPVGSAARKTLAAIRSHFKPAL